MLGPELYTSGTQDSASWWCVSPDGLCERYGEHQGRKQLSGLAGKRGEGERKQQGRKITFMHVSWESTGLLLSIPEAVIGMVFDRRLLKLYIVYLEIQALNYPAEILSITVRTKIFYLFLFCNFHASFVAYSNANQGIIMWTRKETQLSQEKHQFPAPSLETSGRTLPFPRTLNRTLQGMQQSITAVPASHGRSVGLSALCRGLAGISHFPARKWKKLLLWWCCV